MALHLVWHFRDFRVFDHPALSLAAGSNEPVCGLYIDQGLEGEAMQIWTLKVLEDLQNYYKKLGSSLLYFDQNKVELKDLFYKIAEKALAEFDSLYIYALDSYEPKRKADLDLLSKCLKEVSARDKEGKKQAKLVMVKGARLMSGQELTNNESLPLKVFTPFYKRFLQSITVRPLAKAPEKLKAPKLSGILKEASFALDKKMTAYSQQPWEKKLFTHFVATREAATNTLRSFKPLVSDYKDNRNDPTGRTTSQLSPYLAVGLISSHEIYHFFQKKESEAAPFIRQLIWKEFAAYLLDHFPDMETRPFSKKFEGFPWKKNDQLLVAWQKGLTGYPLVDAGMRELWETGWMHNRLRMVVGSFLVKDLLISWKEGAKWFWNTLIDAELGNNTFGWQWVGGMGPDAAPFFRIFNPILQSQKFDPEGAYIRKYVPELSKLDNKQIHTPWLCSKEILEAAGIELGKTYPLPIIDHAEAREEAKKVFGEQET